MELLAIVLGFVALIAYFARPKCEQCGERKPLYNHPQGGRACRDCCVADAETAFVRDYRRTHNREPRERDLRKHEQQIRREYGNG